MKHLKRFENFEISPEAEEIITKVKEMKAAL